MTAGKRAKVLLPSLNPSKKYTLSWFLGKKILDIVRCLLIDNRASHIDKRYTSEILVVGLDYLEQPINYLGHVLSGRKLSAAECLHA